MMTTLASRSDQPAEQRASRRPTACAPAGVNAHTPPTIAATVTHIIPILTKAAAASFVVLIIIFIDNNDYIYCIVL